MSWNIRKYVNKMIKNILKLISQKCYLLYKSKFSSSNKSVLRILSF